MREERRSHGQAAARHKRVVFKVMLDVFILVRDRALEDRVTKLRQGLPGLGFAAPETFATTPLFGFQSLPIGSLSISVHFSRTSFSQCQAVGMFIEEETPRKSMYTTNQSVQYFLSELLHS